jgi:hypothetical protein
MNGLFPDEETHERLERRRTVHRAGIGNRDFEAWLFSADFQEFEEGSRPLASYILLLFWVV